jgi:uncharacterized protein YcbK (DUF882 family)
MTPEQWEQIRYFAPGENWGDAARMDSGLILELDRLRHYLGHRIIIHCGYEPRDGRGFHPQGLAVDCHCENFDPIEFFFAAMRFNFTGLGIYPWWNNPGLHLDKRPTGPVAYRALWGSIGPKEYVELDGRFIKACLKA